jgi:hypothetical protein
MRLPAYKDLSSLMTSTVVAGEKPPPHRRAGSTISDDEPDQKRIEPGLPLSGDSALVFRRTPRRPCAPCSYIGGFGRWTRNC